MRVREDNVGPNKVRIGVEGLLEILCGRALLVVAVFSVRSGEVIIAPKIRIEGLVIPRARAPELPLISRANSRLDPINDLLGYVSLKREGIAQVALIAISPQMFVRGAVDELRSDAHSITGVLHSPFYDPVHVQFARDFG